MGRSREAIRLYDVLHAREKSTRSSKLCPVLVTLVVVATSRGRIRSDVAQAQGPIPLRAVLLAHALADAQPLHELRPPLQHGLLSFLLFLLRCGVLSFPGRLEDYIFILRSYNDTRNYGECLALPEFEARLHQWVSGEIAGA